MSITTRTGDNGTTYCSLLRQRVYKDHPAIEFQGSLDTAISALGLARALLPKEASEVARDLVLIQNILFALGSSVTKGVPAPEKAVAVLEEMVSKYYNEPLRYFILPSGGPEAAIHLARALVREAERRLVTLLRLGVRGIDESHIRVLNRASDSLFAIAVYVARRYGEGLRKAEVSWGFLEGNTS
ncbi:MAG: cob(I)yrinic acid a,c-diamide adenosyltransferase [Desulfurococcales archaeon]|nr:cob(I)yrinic acid a,c-diamide adenosyltransferase [Desulfurococcales archaeon]